MINMSGGHFDYQDFHFSNIADEIQHLIDVNDSTEKDEYGEDIGYHYQKEVIEKFVEAVKIIRLAGKMAHEIDWLVSGDTGEETFLEIWDKQIKGGV